MKLQNDWWLTCPCGHHFQASKAKNWRGAGGKYFDKAVEHSALTNDMECQCPQCLMWIDSTTGELPG